MTAEVTDEGTFGALPLLDVVATSRSRCEGIFRWVDSQCPHGLFVMSQGNHCLACRQVPESERADEGHGHDRRPKDTYRTVESMLPVITCGSDSWHLTSAIVPVCPARTCICALVRISHTRAEASRPEVTKTSRVGCRLSEYTPDRWP